MVKSGIRDALSAGFQVHVYFPSALSMKARPFPRDASLTGRVLRVAIRGPIRRRPEQEAVLTTVLPPNLREA